MPEKPAAVEHSENAILREQACTECSSARVELATFVQADKAPDNEQRKAELLPWVAEHLPGFKSQDSAVEICLQIEQDEAVAGFPSFRVDQMPVEELREELALLINVHNAENAQQSASRRNTVLSGEIDDGVPAQVPAEAGAESRLLTDEAGLESEQKELETQRASLVTERANDQKTDDLEKAKTAELRQLQTAFNQLRAGGMGTVDALRQVITQAENPETKRHLNNVLGRVALLQAALPDKPDVVNRLLNKAGLNLAAATVAGSFADFMSAAETDETLTESDRATLRQVINREERYARTGTDVQTELEQTLITADGDTIPAHPEDKPYQFRDHVAGFTEPDGSQKLRATTTHGERVTLDITGWSGADVGRASELLELWAMTENEGQTNYLTSITKFSWTDTARIDPISLRRAAQVVSALLGHGEGHDGDIFRSDEAIGVIRWQAQLANQQGRTMRDNRDASRTTDALVGLGIKDEDGNLNLDALKAFGGYSRDHSNTPPNYKAVQAHIRRLLPNGV